MKKQGINPVNWSKNIIIVDADFVDHVAFDLIVNFERMLGRRIPQADLSQWLVVVLLHDRKTQKLLHFSPADYESELDGKAFHSEQLGEFIINCIATGEEGQAKGPVLADLVRLLLSEEEVTRLMIVPDGSDSSLWQELRQALRDVDDEKKHVALFTMQPTQTAGCREEMLGFSLMDALGITQAEIDQKMK